MLSSQARHWLEFFTRNPSVRINYRALMERGLSRRKAMEIMGELRSHGDLHARRSRGNGTKLELTRVVSSDITVRQNSSTASKQVPQNSQTARTDSSATNKFLVGDEGEGQSMGWDFFEKTSSGDSDLLAERAKNEARKKAEYAEARAKKAAERRDVHRSKVNPADWTCKDVAYEFSDRLADMWHIKPFSVTQSRFVQALGQFRKQHDTNGALELELLNLFFSSLAHEKYNDGNHLWRAFLYKAPSLLQTARERVITPQDMETAVVRDSELADRKLSRFDEDDDV